MAKVDLAEFENWIKSKVIAILHLLHWVTDLYESKLEDLSSDPKPGVGTMHFVNAFQLYFIPFLAGQYLAYCPNNQIISTCTCTCTWSVLVRRPPYEMQLLQGRLSVYKLVSLAIC